MNLFEKKTKWIPLVAYNAGGTDFMILVRKGIKSGMLYFKIKNCSPFASCSYNFNKDMFDIRKQFETILNN